MGSLRKVGDMFDEMVKKIRHVIYVSSLDISCTAKQHAISHSRYPGKCLQSGNNLYQSRLTF